MSVSVLVVAASGGGDLLVDVLTDLQGNILTRLNRNIQDDLTNRKKKHFRFSLRIHHK